MSGINIPKIPLSARFPKIAKAMEEKSQNQNPSYESFRPNVIHPVQYREIDDTHVSLVDKNRLRRYANGVLDYDWALNHIIDALHKVEIQAMLLPIEAALLTIIFPLKFRKMEPDQASLMTQLSDSEKEMLNALIEAHMRAETNWNAGRGGGAVPGSTKNNVGIG